MSVCEETLGPGLAAYQEMTDAGRFCELADFDDNLARICRGATGEARNRALEAADKRMLCSVLRCCDTNAIPAASGSGRNQYQTCADRTLSAAEGFMGHDSRFKPEVSYNMRTNPPTPLMEKGLFGGLTTESIPWNPGGIAHIKNRIEQDGGGPYEAGNARRPDVTIVRDPSSPPVGPNIFRIVDFKFGGDTMGAQQELAYKRIGGGRDPLVLDTQECDCSNDDETRGQVALAIASQSARENDRSALERLGWGALGTVAMVGAAALALVPLDGPAGETASGAGALAAFSRAFSAVGWTATRRQAAAAASAQRWRAIYGGGP
ncbi:hypothetical protein [Yoonia sp. 2307UL14-13]|uniref:hypothetical protein n=1 Tax=Yoonia sp. 2307UL14-13 TaxID=3126506 RepID=UPI00309EE0A5